jgi:diguanylate cyclase (GGDEF)-like protein
MRKILIISSDAALRDQVAAALPGGEVQLVSTARGSQGVEQFYQDYPDLVLLDLRVEDAGGYQVLQRLVDDPGGADVPVVILGEFARPAEWLEGLDLGASDYLPVPLDPQVLGAKTKVLLRLKNRLDRLKADAVVDELTGVYNRRFLENQLAAKLGEARRYHHPFSYLMTDIDHFKRVNDTLGHQFGDQVLRETAHLTRRQMRKEDILARYGGEEFAVILPHTDRAGTIILGERIRAAVAGHVFRHGGRETRVTVSLGVAVFPQDDIETTEQLIACADRRLYVAKEAGRNRLVYEG